jgi:hypothetical protein
VLFRGIFPRVFPGWARRAPNVGPVLPPVIDCRGFPYFSLFTCPVVAAPRGKPLTSTRHRVWGRSEGK